MRAGMERGNGFKTMKTKIKIGEKYYQVDVSEINRDFLKVRVDDKDLFFKENEFQELIPVDEKELASGSEGWKTEAVLWDSRAGKEIKSPLTGTISGIDIKKGDKVKPGQKLMTLIAMKMENEIVAETAGVVKEIKAEAGKLVNSGDILVKLE